MSLAMSMPATRISLAASYARCREVTRRAGSSFYYPLWLLPKAKREAMYALYAFCRIADDIGDEPGEREAKRRRLLEYRESLNSALSGDSRTAEMPALVDVVRRFDVPAQYLFDILDGVALDLAPRRYATWEELQEYCYHVAGAVGLACLAIWGGHVPEARIAALRCGEAFQLTNILRDVREDALQSRVYLPLADLKACGCDEPDLKGNALSPALRQLMQLEITRARQLFTDSEELRASIPRDARRVFTAMRRVYVELLEEIARRDGDVFSRRVQLSKPRRLWIAATAWRGER